MKLLILSDAHSNIFALDAILRAEADADAILCAGDLTDHGYGSSQSIFDFDRFIGEKPTDARDFPTRLILGHSHRQTVCHFRGDRLFLTPGSISYRRSDDPDKTAHYALILDGEIVLKALSYDLTPLQDEVRRLQAEGRMSEKEPEYGAFFFGLASSVG